MRTRRTVVVMTVAVLALAGFTATYLTMFTFGDPFSGTWTLSPDVPYAVVIKLARGGYWVAVADGQTDSGWVAARRSGWVLTPTGVVLTTTPVFRLWNGHLIETDNGLNTLLTKMSGSTSLPPRLSPAVYGILNGMRKEVGHDLAARPAAGIQRRG